MAAHSMRRGVIAATLLSLCGFIARPLQADDVQPDDIRAAFCRYFETRDVESAFRPISTLASGRISTTSKSRTTSRGKTYTVHTTELKAAAGWSASYKYQQKENGGQYGFALSVVTREPENGLIFNSLSEAKNWLGPYGSKINYDSDMEEYSVNLKMFRSRSGSFETVSVKVEFTEDDQSITLGWLGDEDETTAREAVCQ